mgnify:FL=1
MNQINFNKNDILERVYFITKLVQNQKGTTMQGALTSKSDSMGGIFDRFINTISDSLVFEKLILPKIKTNKEVHVISDYYYYKPSKNIAGIAPDIFGLTINGKQIPFTRFNNKWEAVKGMPQIEVKTFKAKDQMISLRNQDYDDEYLVLIDLNLRIDYLVPFLDATILNNALIKKMEMDDSVFIIEDKGSKITKVTPIDYSSNTIGTLKLISITNATDFMKQTTLCKGNISVRRMKEINVRKTKVVKGLLHDKLNTYANPSPRIKKLYEFNEKWKKKTNVGKNTALLDFSADKLDKIEICQYNVSSIVITALEEGCSFNGTALELGKQYTVSFETLDRSGNGGSEYFIQKQCAVYLNGLEDKLIQDLENVISSVDN